jgi:hypothetical protein
VCQHVFFTLLGESKNTHLAVRSLVYSSQGSTISSATLSVGRSDLVSRSKPGTANEDAQRSFWAPVRVPRTEHQILFCEVFGNTIVKSFGEALPHKSIRVRDLGVRFPQVNIPNGLFVSRRHILQELVYYEHLPTSFKESTFYDYIRHYYPFVCFKKWTPFSKCACCTNLKQQLLASHNHSEAARAAVQSKLQAHRDDIQLARSLMDVRSKLARAFPDHFMFIVADGMDSSKTYMPHVSTTSLASKQYSNTGLPLQTKLSGVLSEGFSFIANVMYPHYEQGASAFCTILHQALISAHNERGKLPPVLFLQLDNCGRENKNHTVFAYLAYLVQKHVFTKIYVNFLPVGETESYRNRSLGKLTCYIPSLCHRMNSQVTPTPSLTRDFPASASVCMLRTPSPRTSSQMCWRACSPTQSHWSKLPTLSALMMHMVFLARPALRTRGLATSKAPSSLTSFPSRGTGPHQTAEGK